MIDLVDLGFILLIHHYGKCSRHSNLCH